MNTDTPKRICLVAMPWSQKDRPSAALGALAAYVRRHRSRHEGVCRHEFPHVAAAIGFPLYDRLADACYTMGELLYLPQLYPEKRAEVRQHFAHWAAEQSAKTGGQVLQAPDGDWGEVFDSLQTALISHRDSLAAALVANYDLVGLTTGFGQLFANLSLAKRIKEMSPRTLILFGGPTISARVGPSIMEEYPFVDYIIQGEGERPLVGLVDQLDQTNPEQTTRGLLSRFNLRQLNAGAPLLEVERMDELPYPEFQEFEAAAEQHGIGWVLPIEGSRGCWYDRVRRTGNPKNACYFCNLNVQWSGYRQKTVERLVMELEALSEKHRNLRIIFLDNIIRAAGIVEFAEAIQRLGKDFDIFYEMRANIKPYELLMMKEAGLAGVQFGIEGLSSSLLKRIGKGTTTIQNLQAMKLCYELRIYNGANLIVDFPGATPEEVEETRKNILEYASAYQPLNIAPFGLGVDSTVDALPGLFQITNVRNSDHFRVGMPEEVWKRLRLFELSYDGPARRTDWEPVKQAVQQWLVLYGGGFRPLLRYQDGGSFVTIADERSGQLLEGCYEGLARDVFMYCMEMRSLEQIKRRFPDADAQETQEVIQQFLDDKLMFGEAGRYLPLALAPTPEIAARRIKAAFLQDHRPAGPVPGPRLA